MTDIGLPQFPFFSCWFSGCCQVQPVYYRSDWEPWFSTEPIHGSGTKRTVFELKYIPTTSVSFRYLILFFHLSYFQSVSLWPIQCTIEHTGKPIATMTPMIIYVEPHLSRYDNFTPQSLPKTSEAAEDRSPITMYRLHWGIFRREKVVFNKRKRKKKKKKKTFPTLSGVLSTQNVATGGAESAESAVGFSRSIILHLDHTE